MKVIFSKEQWDIVKNNADKWWSGTLGRPLIQVNVKKYAVNPPDLPYYSFASFYDFDVSAQQIIERVDYELSRMEFLGDAFPHFWPNFGPGVLPAFMGAKLENGQDTVWFHPLENLDINEIEFKYIPDNIWFLRVKELAQAAIDYWQGSVQIGMTDLGGNMDILSTFRPSEKLVYDLYDNPDAVKKLLWQAHEIWFKYFMEFNSMCSSVNPGYSSWMGYFSQQPTYPLQSDFAYMVGPEIFKDFCLPELKATSQQLSNVIYHLDGKGQLVHLDSLLAVDGIKGIQWVPGAGNPGYEHWPEVYRKITAAGKKIYISTNGTQKPFEILDILQEQLGTVAHIVYQMNIDESDLPKAQKVLEKFDVEGVYSKSAT